MTGASNVSVPVLFTSDAPLGPATEFSIHLVSVQLKDACGNSVTVMQETNTGNQRLIYNNIDVAHTGATSEPVAIVSVPPATYTSVVVTYDESDLGFIYPDYLHYDFSSYQGTETAKTELTGTLTVNSGTALLFDELIPQAIDVDQVSSTGGYDPQATPVFRISALTPSSAPADDRHGRAHLNGLSTSISGARMTVTGGFGTLLIETGSATLYQGISQLADLKPNVPIRVDLNVQPDGTLLATRVAVDDPAAIGAWLGPLTYGYNTGQFQYIVPQLDEQISSGQPPVSTQTDATQFDFTDATKFGTDSYGYDLVDLPFTPSFQSFSDVAAGQQLSASFQVLATTAPNRTAATAVTLIPRTVAGAIMAVDNEARYTAYTISLAQYDYLTPITNQNTIVAYTNSATRMEDGALPAGAAVNLHGLIFNDQGTLRLVCDQTRLQVMP